MCTSAGSCSDRPGRQWLGLGAIAIRFGFAWCSRQSAPSLFLGGLNRLNPRDHRQCFSKAAKPQLGGLDVPLCGGFDVEQDFVVADRARTREHFEFSELDGVVTDRTAPRVHTDEATVRFLPIMFKWLLTPSRAHTER